ncbi:restriction endonuclease subunit S [Paucibacter sp. R3-3]|uniref:Restriction endonuclease subunit S n=1 Tax=Roseateles agri TaxID=3098619 RepID=A0ABU5DAT2_9BURK|nr:restriction endonuclease subunit S [Paucibacter sp. R3-3]MDY0743378.1 restriction endonuclease subunit S [Paucibacter sp. R3-3]
MEVKEPSPRYASKASRALKNNLPVDWQLTRVEDAGAVLGGRQRSPSAQGDPTPYLRVANVFAGWIDTSDVLQMPFTADERARFSLRAGDILLNEGQSLELVGRSAIYRDEPRNCCFQNTLVRFRAGPRTDPNYAQYVFESYLRRGEFSKIALQTTSIAHLGAGRFAQMPFVAPPLGEQKAIGKALADADALIDSLEQLLTKKRQVKQGAMQELLTGKRRLLENGEAWRQVPLGSLGRWSGGMTPSMARVDYWSPAEVPWLSSGDLKTAQLSESAKYVSKAAVRDGTTTVVPANSVVVVMRSGILRKCLPVGITLKPMAINQDLKAIQPNTEVAAEFLLHALTCWGERILATCLKAGTTVESLELRWLKAFTIDLPPVSEQVLIAGVLSDMDSEITALESRLTKALSLKQAMAQALLTGRIRLVEPTA